jgi:hypothetical protein
MNAFFSGVLNCCLVAGTIFFAVKKLMSVIQLISASEQLAEMDME